MKAFKTNKRLKSLLVITLQFVWIFALVYLMLGNHKKWFLMEDYPTSEENGMDFIR